MPKKILFIEDQREFVKSVTSYLEKRGFVVTSVFSGQKAWQVLRKNSYDLVILDLGLPDEDGLKLCAKIRKKKATPILILTAKGGVTDKVAGLNLGADDYLVKPVSLKELIVRINRLFKREVKDSFRSTLFRFNKIDFDTISGALTTKGKSAFLTAKEKAVLEFLLLRKGQALTRMEIMDHVWGERVNVFSNTLNMIISSLRRKLRLLSKKKFIHSVHGLGYKFEAQK